MRRKSNKLIWALCIAWPVIMVMLFHIFIRVTAGREKERLEEILQAIPNISCDCFDDQSEKNLEKALDKFDKYWKIKVNRKRAEDHDDMGHPNEYGYCYYYHYCRHSGMFYEYHQIINEVEELVIKLQVDSKKSDLDRIKCVWSNITKEEIEESQER